MANARQLASDLQDSKTLKMISQTLGEVATLRVRTTRRQIEHASEYFQEISKVFHALKTIAGQGQMRKKNGKTAAILLTSDAKLNGETDHKLSHFFMNKTMNLQADYLVMGKIGQEYLRAFHYPHPFASYDLATELPQVAELQKMVEALKNYSQVFVFYTRFESLLTQSPTFIDLTESSNITPEETVSIHYILEPEIEKMLGFFEDQILVLLLQSIFLQQQLARLAARMVSMNQAEQNSDNVITGQYQALVRAKKMLIDNQILSTYATRKGLVL